MEKTISFAKKHVWKVGAVVWYEFNGEKYFLAFNSISRPSRGTQIVRGKMEAGETFEESILRETAEELGKEVDMGKAFLLKTYEEYGYSDCQVYFSAKLKTPLDPKLEWEHIDLCPDDTQKLIWKSYKLSGDFSFLTRGQDKVVAEFYKQINK